MEATDDAPRSAAAVAKRPSALAQAVLIEVRAEPRTPISARDVGELLGLTEAETFPLLEELERSALAERAEATVTEPVLWQATKAGYRLEVRLMRISDELRALERAREDAQPE